MRTGAIAALVACVVMSGCASVGRYDPPVVTKTITLIDISKPRSEVWKAAVPALARQFFVINNIDQSSGLINVSYGGDPEQYIDCGLVTIETQGRPPLTFPAASAAQSYQFITPQFQVVSVQRRVNLDGRVNLIFEEVAPNHTRVTANTRYIVTRETENYLPNGARIGGGKNTISFNSNQSGRFPPSGGAPNGVECHPTGRLEASILKLLK